MSNKFSPISAVIDSIDNKYTRKSNDSIDNDNTNKKNGPYALRESFNPYRTEQSFTAYEISKALNDDDYAFYKFTVNTIGCSLARTILQETLDDVKAGQLLGKPIKNQRALFNYKVKKAIQKRGVV